MDEPHIDPSPAELALIEAELPEWERLAVRDYWDAVVAEEIGAATESVEPLRTGMPTGPSERRRSRRVRRLVDDTALRLIANDRVVESCPDDGLAA